MKVRYVLLVLFAVAFSASVAQPANNNVGSALNVDFLMNTCSTNGAFTTVAATGDQAKGSCWSNGPNNNVWFSFTATATTFIKAQVKVGGLEGTLQNPFVAIWRDTDPGAGITLNQLSCQDYAGATTDIETSHLNLTPGTIYYISVDNYAGYSGTFSLCLSSVVSDNFVEGATPVGITCSGDGAYTTSFYTGDRANGSCWSNGPNNNRWFSFVATATTFIKAQVKVGGSEGTLQNPFVAIWTDTDANPAVFNLNQLSCQNYAGATTDIETSHFGLTAGTTYYISVDNYAGYSGSFTLCLNDAVTDNFVQGATPVAITCSTDAAYTTSFYTGDQTKGSCWTNGPNNNRWFSFVASGTMFMKAQVKVGASEGTLQNPFVAIWDDTDPGLGFSLSELSCQNYAGATTDIETSYFGLTPGKTYYISVDNYAGYSGSFTLCLNDVVTDNFVQGATPVAITCSADAAYTTSFYTGDQAKGSCWSNGPNNNRWFSFVATATTFMKAQVKVGGSEGTMQNPFVAMWQDTDPGVGFTLSELSCQNYSGATTDIETSYLGLTPGTTYYISVDNYAGYSGSFTLCLSAVVSDNFVQGATPVAITCSADAAYTTSFYTGDQAKGSCWSNGPNNNRWFSFVATATTFMKAQVKVGGSEGTMQNPFVALWDDTNPGAGFTLSQLNCQNYIGATTDIETSYFGLTAGKTYYISVDNYAGYSGSFTLCLSDAVDYNYKEGALDVQSLINSCSTDGAYSTQLATPDQAKGSCWSNGPNNNRWFKFVATTTTMKVEVKIGGSEGTLQNPFVAIWNSSLGQLACQNYISASTDIETEAAFLTVGATYYISVDNYAGYSGSFTLCLSDVGGYDFVGGAKTIGDLDNWCSTNAEFSTIGASPDQAKGSCWSNGPNTNRWFKFVAVYNVVTIQVKVGGAEGSMQNPFVALWNSGLGQVGCTNYIGATTDITLTNNTLVPGQTYYISVDNYAGYQGSFTLCVTNVDPVPFFAIADGNWSTPGIWSRTDGGPATTSSPVSSSVVNVKGFNVTVNSPQSCAALYITMLPATASNTSVTVDGSTLSVLGNLNMNNSGGNINGNLFVQNSGSLNISNDASFTRTAGANTFALTLGNSTMTVARDMRWTSGGGTVATNDMTLNNGSTLTVARDLYLSYTAGMKINNTVNGSSILNVGGDINFTGTTVAAFAEVALNNTATLNIGGDFLRGAGAAAFGKVSSNAASNIVFNATSNLQVFPSTAGAGGDSFYFNNVTLNNSNPNTGGDQLIAAGPATINGAFTLTDGIVRTTSSNILTLASTATTSVGSVGSFIDGPMKYDVASSGSSSINFPLGKITAAQAHWRPLVLNVNHADNIAITYTGEMFNSSARALGYSLATAPTVNRVSGARYWTVSRTTNSPDNFTNATATLYYGTTPLDDEVTDYTFLTVVKNVGAGTNWFDIGGVATGNGNGSITSGSFNTFSNFTFANLVGGTNPLPVELVSFTGQYNGDGVVLKWKTASELNNDYFAIQRSSDGLNFEEIGTVKGNGTTNSLNNYSWLDSDPFIGKNYYRLKQVDFDNESQFSGVIVVNISSVETRSVDVYPNPGSAENVTIKVAGYEKNSTVEAAILSSMGNTVYLLHGQTNNSGQAWIPLENVNLAAGLYFVRVKGMPTVKLIIE